MCSSDLAESFETMLQGYADWLEAYQDRRYAQSFLDAIAEVRAGEQRVRAGSTVLTEVAARNLARLMAYKDEYEVARLFSAAAFREELERQFTGDYTLRYHFAPPFLARRDSATGRPVKQEFGSWVRPLLALLASGRRLRGSRFDPFGMTAERRLERALIADYRAGLAVIVASLHAANFDQAVAALSLADAVRGYGPVKLATIDRYQSAFRDALEIGRAHV